MRSLNHIPHLETLLAIDPSKTMPPMIRVALRGGKRVRVIKIQMRLARLSSGLTLDRDVIDTINTSLKYLKPDGRGVAFSDKASQGAGEAINLAPRANPPHRNKTIKK